MTKMRPAGAVLAALALTLAAAGRVRADEPAFEAGKKAMSLRECVQSALRSNPSLLVAGEARNAARGRTAEARSALLPQVSGTGSKSRSESPERQSLAGGVQFSAPKNTYEETNVSLSVSQSVVDVATWRSVASAKASQDATDAAYRQSQEDLVLSVERSYFGYLKAIHLQGVAEENLKVGEEQLKLAEKRHEVGIGVEADILKARAQHAKDQLGVITTEKDVSVARTTLCHVMGIPLDVPIAVDDIPEDSTAQVPPAVDAEAALDARPDVAEQRFRIRASERSLGAAKAGYIPNLGVDFGYQRLLDAKNKVTLSDSTGAESERVTDFDPYGSWRASASLNWSIFNGGAREARIRQSRSALVAARDDLTRIERDARLAIETATLNASAAAQAIDVSREGVRAAEEDLRVTQGSYTQGILPILNLVQSQAALVESKSAYVSAVYDYRIALAELDRALGKGVAKYAE